LVSSRRGRPEVEFKFLGVEASKFRQKLRFQIEFVSVDVRDFRELENLTFIKLVNLDLPQALLEERQP